MVQCIEAVVVQRQSAILCRIYLYFVVFCKLDRIHLPIQQVRVADARYHLRNQHIHPCTITPVAEAYRSDPDFVSIPPTASRTFLPVILSISWFIEFDEL